MNIEIKKSKKPIKYEDALRYMERRLLEISENKSNQLIWILEHEDIYTAGTSFNDNEIIDTWVNKKWPIDILSEVNWLVKEQARNNNYLKKGDLILTGAYGFPVPINDKK